ncbi:MULTISPECIES: hypothetical protein [Methylosinus]|uniref:Uncharacterized protein n=1 Tax=Methylosinus trichosporium (strain ATCC 35070 / NCIMB 11131 / UNIQEM 75 / OB3b) TaxID=595536 RepID=A0A2D2D0Q4_METT3|nr:MULTISPECIES: hypothetical protein [Methylosinus]ATQ68449.1 hypothetical protein CQW49_11585 [Methylosinus trichosporium OB3b]OBS51316.1 hypothetical protein A8B73_16625 [Methylosinus sp. 3S-1]
MMTRLMLSAALVFAAANAGAAPSHGRDIGSVSPRLVQKTSCDMNKDDQQARCMESCDEVWIKATQAYNASIDKAKIEKKSCEAKCGC